MDDEGDEDGETNELSGLNQRMAGVMYSAGRELLYKALIRQNYFLPDYKSQLCSKGFLLEVKSGLTFMFNTGFIHKLACPTPPPTKMVNQFLVEGM